MSALSHKLISPESLEAVMEAIAEINDLACHSIESGDYQIALDVLNSCLGCVKQLKKFRTPSSESSNNATERRRRATKEAIERTLKVGKQKLSDRLRTVANTNFDAANKRKVFDSSIAITRPRKRRRQRSQNELTIALPSSDVSTTSSVDDTSDAPSRQSPYSFPIAPSCPDSVVGSSSNSCTSSCQRLLKEHFSCQHYQDTEERYFVYRKPIQMSKFQWSRIAECRCQEGEDVEQQNQIHREVELAVSANLIFNIALSHHLIASSTKSELAAARNRRLSLSPDSGDDDSDDEEDDDNGCGYGSICSDEMSIADSLQTKQRLKGALRLYELGFRVHTKRVAFVMSTKTQSSRSSRGYLYSSSSSIPSASSSVSSTASPLSPDAPRSSLQNRINDRDDELKSTTRFALALLNNCAHIHDVLGQSEKAKIFQKRLLSFLLVIVDSGESIHDIIGDDPAVDGYLKNVFAGTVFDKKTAPAAMA